MPIPRFSSDLSTRTSLSPIQVIGPVRFDWLESVARLTGRSKALHTALALAWLTALRGRPDIVFSRRHMAAWSLSRDAAGDALRLLQAHKHAIVWSAPGRARIVILTEAGTDIPLAIR
jgi:hypothetical protein